MKPRMIARRNAELKRKAREAAGVEIEPEVGHGFSSGRGERTREVAIAVSTTAGAILLIIAGLGLLTPALLMLPGFLRAGLAAPIFFFIGGIFLIAFLFLGVFLIRVGIVMLKSAAFQQHDAPILRSLRKLSFDAVPVTGYVVGTEAVTNYVLITFDYEPDETRFMTSLASKLSEPGLLEEIVGDEAYVPDRRIRLPRDLTDGRPVYLADLQVKHVTGWKKVTSRAAVQCVADPGGRGRIVVSQS